MNEQDEIHSSADDEMGYEEELRASIERGLADCAAGRLIPLEELMREFGVEK